MLLDFLKCFNTLKTNNIRMFMKLIISILSCEKYLYGIFSPSFFLFLLGLSLFILIFIFLLSYIKCTNLIVQLDMCMDSRNHHSDQDIILCPFAYFTHSPTSLSRAFFPNWLYLYSYSFSCFPLKFSKVMARVDSWWFRDWDLRLSVSSEVIYLSPSSNWMSCFYS